MSYFSKIRALFVISAAATFSLTGCMAETGDQTEDSDVAIVDENATSTEEALNEENVADESLALSDAADDEGTTAEDESELSTWGRNRWGGYRGGRGRGYHRGWGGHRRFPGYGNHRGFRSWRGYGGYGGYGGDCGYGGCGAFDGCGAGFGGCFADPCDVGPCSRNFW